MTTMPPSPDVTLAIATLAERCTNLTLPAPAPGLRYDILVQRPPAPLPGAARPDVRYIGLDTLGLSHSRNAALSHCETPLLVFCDDDMVLETGGLRALAARMVAEPKLAFAAGWRAGKQPTTGARAGRYDLRKLNAGRVCAPELMVRMHALRRADVQFDTGFGVGAKHPLGEDYIFVCDMLDAGLRGVAFPIVTGAHPGTSTGDIWNDPTLLQARRAVLSRCFGRMTWAVRAGYAVRHRHKLGGWRGAWQFWAGRINSKV